MFYVDVVQQKCDFVKMYDKKAKKATNCRKGLYQIYGTTLDKCKAMARKVMVNCCEHLKIINIMFLIQSIAYKMLLGSVAIMQNTQHTSSVFHVQVKGNAINWEEGVRGCNVKLCADVTELALTAWKPGQDIYALKCPHGKISFTQISKSVCLD